MPIVAILVAGWILTLPVVLWTVWDLGRIPSPVWFWGGHRREHWRTGVLVAYALGGWPALVVALVWRLGSLRSDLREELGYLREQHRARRSGPHHSPA